MRGQRLTKIEPPRDCVSRETSLQLTRQLVGGTSTILGPHLLSSFASTLYFDHHAPPWFIVVVLPIAVPHHGCSILTAHTATRYALTCPKRNLNRTENATAPVALIVKSDSIADPQAALSSQSLATTSGSDRSRTFRYRSAHIPLATTGLAPRTTRR